MGTETLGEACYVFGGQEDGGEFGVFFGDLGEVCGADFGEHVDHYWDAGFIAAAGPLGLLWCSWMSVWSISGLSSNLVLEMAYDSIHTAKSLDVGVVVGLIQLTLATPGCGGAVLLVRGLRVVRPCVEETSRSVSWVLRIYQASMNRTINQYRCCVHGQVDSRDRSPASRGCSAYIAL